MAFTLGSPVIAFRTLSVVAVILAHMSPYICASRIPHANYTGTILAIGEHNSTGNDVGYAHHRSLKEEAARQVPVAARMSMMEEPDPLEEICQGYGGNATEGVHLRSADGGDRRAVIRNAITFDVNCAPFNAVLQYYIGPYAFSSYLVKVVFVSPPAFLSIVSTTTLPVQTSTMTLYWGLETSTVQAGVSTTTTLRGGGGAGARVFYTYIRGSSVDITTTFAISCVET